MNQPLHISLGGDVGDDGFRSPTAGADVAHRLIQAFGTASRDGDRDPFARQMLCDRESDARRCPRDRRDTAREIHLGMIAVIADC